MSTFGLRVRRKLIWLLLNRGTEFLPDYDFMKASLMNMARNGYQPRSVIDIGAYQGEWTTMASQIFPESKFLMLEAQPEKERTIAAVAASHPDKIRYLISLLSSENGTAKFSVMETGSSLFAERTSAPRQVIELPTRRLDDVIAETELTGPFFVKIDVQGAELEVLKGAPKVLEQTTAILFEAAFLEYNAGAPFFMDVANFLSERGFVPYDVCGFLRRKSDKALFQADFVFVRKDHALRADAPF